jgi:hypothetical protein
MAAPARSRPHFRVTYLAPQVLGVSRELKIDCRNRRRFGALRNGAPFLDMPEPLQRLRRALLREAGGDRVMAQVLALVPESGLDAVLIAVALALEHAPPSGRVSVEHVVNVLSRLRSVQMPPKIDTALQLETPPQADTSRYDGLRTREANHA